MPETLNGTKKTAVIMLASDNADQRIRWKDGLTAYLAQHHVAPVFIEAGSEAEMRSLLTTNPPSLLITADYFNHEKIGRGFVRQLREGQRYVRLPVIIADPGIGENDAFDHDRPHLTLHTNASRLAELAVPETPVPGYLRKDYMRPRLERFLAETLGFPPSADVALRY